MSKRILLVNDDGYKAYGINLLYKLVQSISEDSWMVAPNTNNSSISSSLDPKTPFEIIQHEEKIFSVTSTPVVSVSAGIDVILKDKSPDIVLSGINRGSNLGSIVRYSGTLGAAMEALFFGIPAIALSQRVNNEMSHDDIYDSAWNISEFYLSKVLPQLIDFAISNKLLLSVNLPQCDVSDLQGIVQAPQSQKVTAKRNIIRQSDGLYHIEDRINYAKSSTDNDDYNRLNSKFITITPYTMNWNDYQNFDKVAQFVSSLKL